MPILPLKRKEFKAVMHGDAWRLDNTVELGSLVLDSFDLLVWSLCDGKNDFHSMTEVMSDIHADELLENMRLRVEDTIMSLTEKGLLDLVSTSTS